MLISHRTSARLLKYYGNTNACEVRRTRGDKGVDVDLPKRNSWGLVGRHQCFGGTYFPHLQSSTTVKMSCDKNSFVFFNDAILVNFIIRPWQLCMNFTHNEESF